MQILVFHACLFYIYKSMFNKWIYISLYTYKCSLSLLHFFHFMIRITTFVVSDNIFADITPHQCLSYPIFKQNICSHLIFMTFITTLIRTTYKLILFKQLINFDIAQSHYYKAFSFSDNYIKPYLLITSSEGLEQCNKVFPMLTNIFG